MVARLERVVQGGSDTVIVKPAEKPEAILSLSERARQEHARA